MDKPAGYATIWEATTEIFQEVYTVTVYTSENYLTCFTETQVKLKLKIKSNLYREKEKEFRKNKVKQ